MTFTVNHAHMRDDFSSAAAVARWLRANMVGWSHALCDEIDALPLGGTVDVQTLYGPATVLRTS